MAEEENTSVDKSMDDGDMEVVTLKEILQNEEQLMDNVSAVLGAMDDKKCTYSDGYLKRQALYSCLTCIPEARDDLSKAAGICLACCLHCHDGHDLVELYTKRNFRCDCGNDKFPNMICTLDNTKCNVNELNHYNQNFSGLYCTCSRPYPDPEDPIEDDMIQCIICEDWYHSRHLGVETPGQSYSEMICEACVKKHQFLSHYDGLSISKPKSVSVERPEVDVLDIEADAASTNTDISSNITEEEDPLKLDDKMELEGDNSESSNNAVDVVQINSNSPLEANSSETCKMPKLKSSSIYTMYWPNVEWRNQLCTCSKCLKMYEDQNVSFLLDPQDTVQIYEEKGKEKDRELQEEQQEKNTKWLNSLNRVPLLETIAGYNDMKADLKTYLKKFAENKKVVREEDIKEFFASYNGKKKQKCIV